MESKYNYFCLFIQLLIVIINSYFLISSINCGHTKQIFNRNSINISSINYISSFQEFYFNLSYINYYFSYNLSKVELKYILLFLDKDKNLLEPSDLALFYNQHIFCIMKKQNSYLQSVSNIEQNKFFSCLEYFELNQQVEFGFRICNDIYECKTIYLFDQSIIDYNNQKYLNDELFSFYYIHQQYSSLFEKAHSTKNDKYLLEKSYISLPICSTKENAIPFKNIWYFRNVYNHYFCVCKGVKCSSNKDLDECKYYLYLNIIDKNKNIYKKTHYLLLDFLYSNRAPGDAYIIFREMVKQNMSAYYLTERNDIYQEYYDNKTKFQKIIPIINKQYNINGDFLEKYLILFLKLKSVISGSEFFSKENIFYNIKYITFICLGHGVNYFKPFLYKDYYGCRRYNKIILPSKKIISIAKKYGWKENDIIKIGLPKWDLFDKYSSEMKNKTNEKCIFMMFTWRKFREGKDISSNYFKNILELVNNQLLTEILYQRNITFYLSLHHNLLNKESMFQSQNKVKYINQEDIITCLMKCDLVISDFSSIIFDLMYRNRPFILFIPDSDDQNINELYDDDYFNIINAIKNDSIKFENKCFNVSDAVKKIQYYVENNFNLDIKLKELYKEFGLNHNHNINHLIEYLKTST